MLVCHFAQLHYPEFTDYNHTFPLQQIKLKLRKKNKIKATVTTHRSSTFLSTFQTWNRRNVTAAYRTTAWYLA